MMLSRLRPAPDAGIPPAGALVSSALNGGIGAARAMQVHPSAGAYAALALGLQVLLAALLMPVALWLLSR